MKNEINRAEQLVNLYYDAEISRDEEIELFDILSEDNSIRELFRQMRNLENNLKKERREFPDGLEEKIFTQLSGSQKTSMEKSNLYYAVLRYAAVILVVLFSSYMYFQNSFYQNELEQATRQIKKQEQLINQVINNLPAAEVTPNQTEKVVIVSKL